MAFEPDEGDDTLAVSGPEDEVRRYFFPSNYRDCHDLIEKDQIMIADQIMI